MLAKIGNMADHIFNRDRSTELSYCSRCGAEQSANKGDYWDCSDDLQLLCCDKPMVLVTKRVVMEDVKL